MKLVNPNAFWYFHSYVFSVRIKLISCNSYLDFGIMYRNPDMNSKNWLIYHRRGWCSCVVNGGINQFSAGNIAVMAGWGQEFIKNRALWLCRGKIYGHINTEHGNCYMYGLERKSIDFFQQAAQDSEYQWILFAVYINRDYFSRSYYHIITYPGPAMTVQNPKY